MITAPIVDGIVQAVHDQGRLTKAQVLDSYGILEEEYKDLQSQVLGKDGLIEKGPRKIGGFVVRKRKGRLPDDSVGDTLLLREEWEKQAVGRLAELLQHAELEELLGTVLQTIRQVRKEETGEDRRGTKPELATALLIRHGIDLFVDTGIRQHIAKASGVKCPEKWHPGKTAALTFIVETGFPRELAGLPTPEGLPDYEYLEGRFELRGLWDFQKEVKASLHDTLRKPGDRAIVTLPTGAGKTRVAVESIRDWLSDGFDKSSEVENGSAVLWLAHTEELCEQAFTCFSQVWHASENVCPLYLFRFWGKYTQDLAKNREVLRQLLTVRSVLVSTPQRLVNLLDRRIQEGDPVLDDLKKALRLIVIDEAHRAAAPSYRRILLDLIPSGRHVSVAGLTATPFRGVSLEDNTEAGTKELKELFHKLIEPIDTLGDAPCQRLQEMGVLARPVFETIQTRTVMSVPPDLTKTTSLSEEEIERIDKVLAVKADTSARRLEILKRFLPIAQDDSNSVLYFGPSVADAECMAFLLRRAGVPAAFVSGETRDVTRRQIVTEFKQKKIRVLCERGPGNRC